jgi:hypothetical protein
MDKHLNMALGALALCAVFVAPVANSQAVPSTTHVSKKLGASTTAAQHKSARASSPAASAEELDQIKQQIADRDKDAQQRFDTLQQQNLQLGKQLAVTQEKLSAAEERIDRLTLQDDPQIVQLKSAVAEVKAGQVTTSAFVEREKKLLQQSDHPLALHYKGIDLTPGGFFAGSALYRSHAENADINTSWSAIPFDGQVMAHLSEFRATARQTQLSLRAHGMAGNTTLTGYFETDFLGTGYGATEVQSNGYSNRIRQLWGRTQFANGWTFSGGQMWSLVTTNRTGIENLTEFNTTLIDGSQFMGNDYARQTAFRVTKAFFAVNKITAAFAAENAATVGVTPANVPASVTNVLSGLSTTGTGALSNTTYSTNVAPDMIAKVAFDPKYGHFEVKAIGRIFRDHLDSTPAVAATKTTAAVTAVPGSTNTTLNGAIGGAAIVPVFTKKVNYIAEGMWGAIGRYGATSTDVVVTPTGALSVEKSVHALTGIETHPTAKIDWYAYASDEYLPRNHGFGLKTINNAGCFIEATAGSSTAPSCSPSTRNVEGGTTGVWYRPYKGSAGTLQYGVNYIYVVKNTWVGVGGAPRGIENIFETSFRYYLP